MDRPIGFMHLPKTGGTSIFQIIMDRVPALTPCPSPRLGVWNYPPDRLQGYNFYAGHFEFEVFSQIGAGVVKLTMLRHPVARMVSLYDYWRGFRPEEISHISEQIPDNGPRFASAVSFGEFIEAPTPFVKGHVENGLTRQLLGNVYNDLLSDPAEMIGEAYKRLMTFDWIGLTEFFEKSVEHLAKLLGSPVVLDIPKLNSSYQESGRMAIARTHPTKREIALVQRCNFADTILYNRICGSSQPGTALHTCGGHGRLDKIGNV